MKKRIILTVIAAVFSVVLHGRAQIDLGNGLVSYWPLDEIVGGTQTPDVVSGLNMNLSANMSAENVVPGYQGNAFHFDATDLDMLSRVHTEGEALPINQNESFTVSLWVRGLGSANDDDRVFSEASTLNNQPLFNIGTSGGGANDSVDIYIRRANGNQEVAHALSTNPAFDGVWRHIVFRQEDGARSLYIDGVLDGITMNPKAAGDWEANNTTIGGILRSSAIAHFTGDIDEVAVWSRALEPEEITEVNANGVPEVFSGGAPLKIRTFTADFPAVVAGDTIALRWEVTGATSISIEPGIGSVDDNTSEVGIGSVDVQVDEATTFTITAAKGAETVTDTVRVNLVGQNVAAGWRVVDDFETYVGAPLENQSDWVNPIGVTSVKNLGSNQVLTYSQAGVDVGPSYGITLYKRLNSLSIAEGESATAFFRFYVDASAAFFTQNLNLAFTDRDIGLIFQLGNDFGPRIQFQNQGTGFDSSFQVGAVNGVGSGVTAAPDEFGLGTVFNVWIDMVNNPAETEDTFSVHIAEEGASERITLFQDNLGDRDPASAFAGGPTLDKLFMLLPSAADLNIPQDAIWIDDIYLSSGGLNSTVPVPASSFVDEIGGGGGQTEVTIASFGLDSVNSDFTLEWDSFTGATFQVWKKNSISEEWTSLVTDYPTGGATAAMTSYTDTDASTGTTFYQVSIVNGGSGGGGNEIFFDDFEGGNTGWTATNLGSGSIWEFGAAAGNGPSAAFSGTNMWGTDLNADAAAGTSTTLTSPDIDLTEVTEGRLTFRIWSDTSDEITVDVYNAETDLFFLADFLLTFSGTSPGWFEVVVTLPTTGDLDAAPCEDQGVFGKVVYFEFGLGVNAPTASAAPGVFIDDVRVIQTN